MKELIAAGGTGFIIPAVLFALLLYAARGLFSLHGRRSQHRKDLLDMWSEPRSQDDFWLEVAVRHWLGTYMPAHVIRLGLEQPDKTQSLLDLSELWPLLVYDSRKGTVRWARARHCDPAKVRLERLAVMAAYFVCAFAAIGCGRLAAQLGTTTFSGWFYGALALLLPGLAIICLMREDTLQVVARCGDRWVLCINQRKRCTPETEPKKTVKRSAKREILKSHSGPRFSIGAPIAAGCN